MTDQQLAEFGEVRWNGKAGHYLDESLNRPAIDAPTSTSRREWVIPGPDAKRVRPLPPVKILRVSIREALIGVLGDEWRSVKDLAALLGLDLTDYNQTTNVANSLRPLCDTGIAERTKQWSATGLRRVSVYRRVGTPGVQERA